MQWNTDISHGIIVSITAVFGKRVAVKLSTRDLISDCLHLRKQRAVEAVVVAICEKVVVARER